MARSVAWQRTSSDAVSWHQDQANNTTIFILREMGPTGFLLKEENETGKFKVYLGDPHMCTCPTFKKEKELCKHICWVLLKKFKIPRQNPLSWQLGLVEREINEVLRGVAQVTKTSQGERHAVKAEGEGGDGQGPGLDGMLPQRPISAEDVCPICQDELLAKHLPVTYCKYGCGNSVHIKCMKVWAEHQSSTGETNIKCPFCRENFGPLSSLQQELRNTRVGDVRANIKQEHPGTVCLGCDVTPITAKCYKCTVCPDVYLCQRCFTSPVHMDHSFMFRERTSQRWRTAQRGSNPTLPSAVVQNLMSRDITDEDYDLLLQLDSEGQELSQLTEETVKSLPMEQIRTSHSQLLAPGQQCRVCLQHYSLGQWLRRLPCKHHFHKDCIDNWLLHHQAKCPIDGMTFTNQSIKRWKDAIKKTKQEAQNQRQKPPPSRAASDTSGYISLEIPGVGISRQASYTDSTTSSNLHLGLALTHSKRSGSGPTEYRSRSNGMQADLNITGHPSFNISAEASSMRPVRTDKQDSPTPGMSALLSRTREQDSPTSVKSLPHCRQPIAPSIPAPHHHSSDLMISAVSNTLPPKHSHTGHPGRLLSKKIHTTVRTRSSSRGRSTKGAHELYIGNKPGNTGVINEYMTETPKRRASSDTAAEAHHRWGSFCSLSGNNNDIVLSGSAFNTFTIHDNR